MKALRTGLLVAALGVALAGCGGPDRPPETRLSRPVMDPNRLAAAGVALYLPPQPVGEVRLRDVASVSETNGAVELDFTTFHVYETRVTPAFRPPLDCGPPTPLLSAGTHPCPTSVTTARGRVIHRYDSSPSHDSTHYVQLGETLVVFDRLLATFAPERLAAVVDAFEPATAADVVAAMDATYQEEVFVISHPERFIAFTPQVPDRIPRGYTPWVVAFGNLQDIHRPYLVMTWRAEAGELHIQEYARPADFAPPASCGGQPEGWLGRPCDLRVTTPCGRPIYTGRSLSPAFVPLGDTVVRIDHNFEGEQETLVRLVDSLAPERADRIRQFTRSQ